jgi:hypothetical protein
MQRTCGFLRIGVVGRRRAGGSSSVVCRSWRRRRGGRCRTLVAALVALALVSLALLTLVALALLALVRLALLALTGESLALAAPEPEVGRVGLRYRSGEQGQAGEEERECELHLVVCRGSLINRASGW